VVGARPTVKLGAAVRDGDEMIGPPCDAGSLQTVAEVRRQRIRLDRRSGLARQQIQRAIRRRRRVSHGAGIRRIQHVQSRPAWRNADHGAEHFRREARSTHAQQNDVGEAVAFDAAGQGFEPADRIGHQQR
jgi:hypothetical protein